MTAGRVFYKDAGYQFPESSLFRCDNERLHSRAACPLPARVACHVDRIFSDPGIAGTRSIAGRRGKTDQTVILFRDDDGVMTVEPFSHVIAGARLSLKRGEPIFDPLVIDSRNSWRVVRRSGTNEHGWQISLN